MTNKNFIVLYNEFGDTCDGIPRFLSEHNTLEEAQEAMDDDIDCYSESNDDELERTTDDDNHVCLYSN